MPVAAEVATRARSQRASDWPVGHDVLPAVTARGWRRGAATPGPGRPRRVTPSARVAAAVDDGSGERQTLDRPVRRRADDLAFVVVAGPRRRTARANTSSSITTDGQDRCGERERVEADAEEERVSVPAAAPRPSSWYSGHVVVVDRPAPGAVVLRRAEQLLGVFPDDVAPQVEVIATVPQRDAGRLELRQPE